MLMSRPATISWLVLAGVLLVVAAGRLLWRPAARQEGGVVAQYRAAPPQHGPSRWGRASEPRVTNVRQQIESIRPNLLPESVDDLPKTPEMKAALDDLMAVTDVGQQAIEMINFRLGFRSALATCGIDKPGRVDLKISVVPDEARTVMFPTTVEFYKSSFTGDDATKVSECIKEAALFAGNTEAIAGPHYQTRDGTAVTRYESVTFPIGTGEFYDGFVNSPHPDWMYTWPWWMRQQAIKDGRPQILSAEYRRQHPQTPGR